MNALAAGKFALCICTGALVGAGVNEARHNKPAVSKSAAKSPNGAGRKVIQFPCEPYIVQDQMLRDTEIPVDFNAVNLPEFAELALPGGGGGPNTGGDGGDGGGGPNPGGGGGGGTDVPEPALLGLLGLGVGGLIGGRKALLARLRPKFDPICTP